MLIVVVIIGILAAALMPRLQGAQASARDTTRKTWITQLMQGLEIYNTNLGYYPGSITEAGVDASVLVTDLVTEHEYMKNIPADPNKKQIAKAKINATEKAFSEWQFGVVAVKKNGTPKNGVILIAKVETPEAANRTKSIPIGDSSFELMNIKTCGSFKKGTTTTAQPSTNNAECQYTTKEDLLFIQPL